MLLSCDFANASRDLGFRSSASSDYLSYLAEPHRLFTAPPVLQVHVQLMSNQ